MIKALDLYHVLTAVVPLYVAMILAYGSVKWWKIFSPDQCSGINRFVALFAVPLLSFHFISLNNPYKMNYRFIAADTLQKLIVLAVLAVWSRVSRRGSLEWSITLFSLSTLPNTLVMGIPLLRGMYGPYSGDLMVQIVVLQCIIWYTLMLFLFEFRAARTLISNQFPGTAAASIISIRVDPDVVSLDGSRQPLETEAEVGSDGKLRVTVRRSSASRSDIFKPAAWLSPRPSNLTNAEIYSLQSSRNPTPRGSSFNHAELYSVAAGLGGGGRGSNFGSADVYGLSASFGPTPRPSNYEEDKPKVPYGSGGSTAGSYPAPNPGMFSPKNNGGSGGKRANVQGGKRGAEDGGGGGRRDLHMFVWSSSTSPVSDVFGNNHDLPTGATHEKVDQNHIKEGDQLERDEFSFRNRRPENVEAGGGDAMPPTSVMTRLILIMVWRKLIRNPNTYSSLIGITWSLVSFRWHIEMPAIIAKSISILSDAGLGMAMFSLGLFMALQPKIIACGNSVATFAMAVRFLTGPAVMAAASLVIGLRGDLLRVAIVQAALPQGIVPFVFAKEYGLHPDILSTAVIFGMLIALPITLVYYILLGI